jgi:hypothetical protein
MWHAASAEETSPARLKYELELLLPGVIRTFGSDGGVTLLVRAMVTICAAPFEGQAAALGRLASLIGDSSATFGTKSLITLFLRFGYAQLTGDAGDSGKARDLMREVQVGLEEAVGADAPIVAEVREAAGKWAAAAPPSGFRSWLKRSYHSSG